MNLAELSHVWNRIYRIGGESGADVAAAFQNATKALHELERQLEIARVNRKIAQSLHQIEFLRKELETLVLVGEIAKTRPRPNPLVDSDKPMTAPLPKQIAQDYGDCVPGEAPRAEP